MNLFKHRLSLAIVNRDRCKLRLMEWQADLKLTNEARKILDSIPVRYMLDVLQNEHPSGMVMDGRTPLEMRAFRQAMCEGYTMALANLEALAQHVPVQKPVDAEFKPEETE